MIKKLLCVTAISFVALIGVAYATDSAPVEKKPEVLYEVVAHHKGNDIFVTEDGNEWCYVCDKKFNNGSKVILTMSDNGTEKIQDDIICDIELAARYCDVPLSYDLQDHIRNICAEYPGEYNKVTLELVLAVIQQESNFNASEVGDNCSSYGLMQVRQMCHEDRMKKLGVTDLLDPYQNVQVGIDYLAELLQKYTLLEALTAYNAGEGGAHELYFSKGVTASPYAEEVWAKWRALQFENCI